MNSPASTHTLSSSWMPIAFPSAPHGEIPRPHEQFACLQIPAAARNEFYSTKKVRKLAETAAHAGQTLDFAALEAHSQRAWEERPSVLSLQVRRESLNFFGRAFGGNLVEWHMRAALVAASSSHPSSALFSTRITKGSVEFTAPVVIGDEVRLFVEPTSQVAGELLRTAPFINRYRVTMVARRAGGFADVPLSIMEVGSSEIDVVHIPASQDRLAQYSTLQGFDISRIVINELERCHPNDFTCSQLCEALIRRASQLTAAADIRFYVFARNILGGDRERDPIVTRDLSFELLDPVFQQRTPSAPLDFTVTHHGEKRRVSSHEFLKLQAVICSADEEFARVSATMVRLGRP